ncbi:hypothetical protein PR202_gb28412 [Eleusine coracana subsp. coracana]|uniref:Pentatricopeptide repeat-containing protein n=1 Tax=Eleusine coracana subsp. coracana TaxID=191504 RepID=A0AAV5FWA5_ELECO|nr:hypothetical protein PR202_gb28412 [Eleusine coracana subsp. coracana]
MPASPWPTPRSVRQAAELHALLTTSGRLLHPPSAAHLFNALTNSLSPSEPRHLRYALSLFDRMPHPTTFLFDTALRACFRAHAGDEPIVLYRRMRRADVLTDSFTFHFLFKCCSSARTYAPLCRMLHAACLRTMLPSAAPLVANPLIHMYAELGLADDARRAFGEITMKDAVSWTMVIGGLAKMGFLDEARKLLVQAPERNVISWTSLIAAYSRAGRAAEAVYCFNSMLSDGIAPDEVTVIGVLSACGQLKDLDLGRSLHLMVKEKRMSMTTNLVVALIDMYAKCGCILRAQDVFDAVGRGQQPQPWNAIIDGYCKVGNVDVARLLFDQMDTRDVITFNSMITGYIHSGRLRDALLLFMQMRRHSLRADNFTLVSLLTACASLGALPQGRALHACIEQRLVEEDTYLGTALLDMYLKCGRVNEATIIFQRMDVRDVRTWTVMIAGLAFNGMGKAALEHFCWMKRDGLRPNSVTYIAVLNLLGRSGLLDEAMDLLQMMPMEPNAVIWGSILSACRVHKEHCPSSKMLQSIF